MTNTIPTPVALPAGAATDPRGRTALVTGGGIGRACVRALAEAGATVHVVDRDGAAAEAVAKAAGGVAHEVDLADRAAIDRLPADVDILVNDAGLQHVAPLTEFPPERFELIQNVMVTAPFLLMRRTLPGWGRVVNVSSVHGLRASAYKAAYVVAQPIHASKCLMRYAVIRSAQGA